MQKPFYKFWNREESWHKANTIEGIRLQLGASDASPVSYVLNRFLHHAILVGMKESGKSTALSVVIAQAVTLYPPAELRLWLCDCHNKWGDVFYDKDNKRMGFPHIDWLVSSDKPSDISAMVSDLKEEIQRRKAIFDSEDVESYEEYRASGAYMPRILVVADNVSTIWESNSRKLIKSFNKLFYTAHYYGIHILMSCNDTRYIPSDIMEQCRLRLALHSFYSTAMATIGVSAPWFAPSKDGYMWATTNILDPINSVKCFRTPPMPSSRLYSREALQQEIAEKRAPSYAKTLCDSVGIRFPVNTGKVVLANE